MLRTILVMLIFPVTLAGQDNLLKQNGWPKETSRVEIVSSKDATKQPAIVFSPKEKSPRPLLVALHTWSGNYLQGGGETVYARWCMEQDWHFIHPDFRGPNRTRKALGSEHVVQDILDAVEYMKKKNNIDESRIYLVGVSGGGHAALLMAGRAPQVWAGVSSWCPISDIEEWWKFHAVKKDKYAPGKYAKDIEQAIGGRPDKDSDRKADCRRRSPLTFLSKAIGVNLDINHGVHDGRLGSVPFTHSLAAFSEVAESTRAIKPRQRRQYYKTQKLPAKMYPADKDALYGKKQPLFRRESGNARVTIFDGGHEIIHVAALNWLAHQQKGKPAVWELERIRELSTDESESKSNR